MAFAIRFGRRVTISFGVLALLKSRSEAACVTESRVRRLRMQEISTKNGSAVFCAITPTAGIFNRAASFFKIGIMRLIGSVFMRGGDCWCGVEYISSLNRSQTNQLQ